MTFSGTWTHGGRIEALSNDFDGDLNNNPPTITSTVTAQSVRNTSGKILEFVGIAFDHQGTASAIDTRTSASSKITTTNCYVKVIGSASPFGSSNSSSVESNNSVFYGSGQWYVGNAASNAVMNNSTFFTDINSSVTSTGTVNNSVIVNSGTGSCFTGGVTQSNNASTDATADTLDNIVVATEFVDSDPVGSGDYRIKAGSDLDTNGIGAFIQSAGGISITPTLGAISYSSQSASISLTGSVDVVTTLGAISYSSQNTSISLTGDIDVNATLGLINYNSQNTLVSLSGEINVNPTLGAITYSSQNTTVSVTGDIDVISTLGAINYTSNNTTVDLSGAC